MRIYQILSHIDGSILYAGQFSTFTSCLEYAVNQGTPLQNADLRHQNLTNANLDDAKLKNADFSHSNLTGANLSEAELQGARFTQTSLYNTCMAYSNLTNTDFRGAHFGATDLIGADISHSLFSISSAAKLDFARVKALENCGFELFNHQIIKTSTPPIAILGVTYNPMIYIENRLVTKSRDIFVKKELYPSLFHLLLKHSGAEQHKATP